MKILITGAGGYIGIPLCKALAKEHEVWGVDRFYFGKIPENITVTCCDIRQIDFAIYKQFDYIIDLAGLSNDASAEINPELTRAINYEGAVRLAKLAKESGVKRYLYSSSASVYGNGKHLQLKETDELYPQTLYAELKAKVEDELLKLNDSNFQVVILRNSTVYGLAPRMRFDLAVNIMTLRAYKENIIYLMGGGEQWRPFVHVDDVVNAFIFLMKQGQAGQIYNVGGENLQLKDLAVKVKQSIPDAAIYNIPDGPDKRDYNLCFDKLNQAGFYNVNLVEDGIQEIITQLESGYEPDDTCYTLQWYKKLIEWEQRIKDLQINGSIF